MGLAKLPAPFFRLRNSDARPFESAILCQRTFAFDIPVGKGHVVEDDPIG
jgi:hypothetical protein